MNDTQFKLFIQEMEDTRNRIDIALYDARWLGVSGSNADNVYNSYKALEQNCDMLVEQLRNAMKDIHHLRERLKKYEPET